MSNGIPAFASFFYPHLTSSSQEPILFVFILKEAWTFDTKNRLVTTSSEGKKYHCNAIQIITFFLHFMKALDNTLSIIIQQLYK